MLLGDYRMMRDRPVTPISEMYCHRRDPNMCCYSARRPPRQRNSKVGYQPLQLAFVDLPRIRVVLVEGSEGLSVGPGQGLWTRAMHNGISRTTA